MSKLSLNPDDLQVSAFPTQDANLAISTIGGHNSWPDVCTCIGICDPSADVYCSGGCPPFATIAQAPVAPVGMAPVAR